MNGLGVNAARTFIHMSEMGINKSYQRTDSEKSFFGEESGLLSGAWCFHQSYRPDHSSPWTAKFVSVFDYGGRHRYSLPAKEESMAEFEMADAASRTMATGEG